MNNKSKNLFKKETKISKKEYSKMWKLAESEINEWIRFKCELFAHYNSQQK